MAIQYNRLLVALDGSELADQVLPHACRMAAAFGAELVLFQVVREVQPEPDYTFLADRFVHPTYRYTTADALEDVKQQYLLKETEQVLTRLSRELENEGIASEVVIKIGDHPADKIIDYVTQKPVDMILMSTHGRTGLSHLVYGSVAEAVLHRAPCPVFLIRSIIE
jgi:nucleotide-binding universal stress UspA family protein